MIEGNGKEGLFLKFFSKGLFKVRKGFFLNYKIDEILDKIWVISFVSNLYMFEI